MTVLDHNPPGNGCSYGNGGLVVPSHFEPLAAPGLVKLGLKMMLRRDSPFGFRGMFTPSVAGWISRFLRAANAQHVHRCAPILANLNLASRELYETRYRHLNAGYARSGELMLCKTEASLRGESAFAQEGAKYGLETEVLSRSDLQRLETGAETDAAGAVLFKDDGRLTPPVFMEALRAELQQRGVVFQQAKVGDFHLEGQRLSAVDSNEADLFVIAAGAWTGRLASKLGLRMPLLGGKGYGFTLASPVALPKFPGILVEGRVAYTPMLDGLRFVGTMELGDPDDSSINASRVAGMIQSIKSFFPQFVGQSFPGLDSIWSGQRPCAPDGMPYLGRSPKTENVLFAAGHGMMGMSLGPISGELIGQLAERAPTSIDLSSMSPGRYA